MTKTPTPALDAGLYCKAIVVQSEDQSRIGQIVHIPPSVVKAILKLKASMELQTRGDSHA